MQSQFREYTELSRKEIDRLTQQKLEVESALSQAQVMLEELGGSARPSTQNSQTNLHNQTVASNFTMETVDVEDLRQQIASASFELEEQRSAFRKQMAKREKELEISLETIE